MNESNRRIASLNRIDELNQRIAFQNDPKRPVDSLMGRQDRSKRAQEPPRAAQDPLKTAQKPPKTLQRGPKSPQERPKTPPRRPKNPPRSTLGTVLEPSWDHPITRSKTRSLRIDGGQGLGVDFGSPNGSQNDPKTTPKRVKNQDETCITFLSFLDPSWTGLEAILGPILGSNGAQNLGKRKSA